MESWPAFETVYENAFVFVLRADPVETYMTFTFGSIIFEGIIDWGDGEYSEITQYDTTPSHTYARPGDYIVRMIGYLWEFRFNSTGTANTSGKMPVVVITPFPAYPIDRPLPGLQGIVRLTGVFSDCPNLYAVPDDVFRRYKIPELKVSMTSGIFARDESLLRIPEDLLKGLVFTGSYVGLGHFNGCRSIKVIPPDLYDNDDLIGRNLDLSSAFTRCSITEIPDGLFDKCGGAQTVRGIFRETLLESVQSDLFDGLPNIIDFTNAFLNCSHITSSVPELWVDYPNVYSDQCFEGCRNAANWTSIPRSWGGPAQG